MKKRTKWILASIAVLLVVIVAAQMAKRDSGSGTKVTTEKISRNTIVETVNASGKVYPEVEVKISSDVSGEITELNVQEGDSVRKGQVLARVYADIIASQRDEAAARVEQAQATVANSEAGLAALKAQLDQAQQAYNRNKQLFDEKVISRAEFEQAETALRTAQSQYNAARQNIRSLQAGTRTSRTSLEAANKNLSRTTLVAPMDGVISSLSVKVGERVAGSNFSVGPEMMRVADMSNMEVRVNVGENDIIKVKLGDSADVTIEAYNDRKFRGVVTQIASSTIKSTPAGAASGGEVTDYEVRIRLVPGSYADLLGNGGRSPFRPGMNASADIKTRRKDNVIAVPIAAVGTRVSGSDKSAQEQREERSGEEEDATPATGDLEVIVFVVNGEGKVQKRVITTGIQDINHYEVLTGLREGETVVTAPYDAIMKELKTGETVRVVSREELYEKK